MRKKSEVRGQRSETAGSVVHGSLFVANARRGTSQRTTNNGQRTFRAFTLLELLVTIAIIAILVGLSAAVVTAVTSQSEARQTRTVLQQLDTAITEWETRADRKLMYGDDNVPPGTFYEIQASTTDWPDVLKITELVGTIGHESTVQAMIAGIKSDFLARYDNSNGAVAPLWLRVPDPSDPDSAGIGTALGRFNAGAQPAGLNGLMTVLDAWGTPIRVIHAGRVRQPNIPAFASDANPPSAATFDRPPFEFDHDGTIRTREENIYGFTLSRRERFVSAGPDRKFGNHGAAVGTPELAATKDNLYSYAVDEQ